MLHIYILTYIYIHEKEWKMNYTWAKSEFYPFSGVDACCSPQSLDMHFTWIPPFCQSRGLHLDFILACLRSSLLNCFIWFSSSFPIFPALLWLPFGFDPLIVCFGLNLDSTLLQQVGTKQGWIQIWLTQSHSNWSVSTKFKPGQMGFLQFIFHGHFTCRNYS